MFMLLMIDGVIVQADAPITAIAIAADGKQVVLGSQTGIEIRSWPGLAVISTLSTELEHVHDLKFSADGLSLLAAGGSPAESGRVELWSWPTGKRIHNVSGHDDVVYRVAWSPDGKQWVTGSGDGRCLVFSAATAERLTQYEGHSRAVLAVCYLDDRTVASVGVDQTVRLWNSSDGSHLRTLDNHVGTVNDIAVRPPKEPSVEVIATISEDRTVRLWQPRIGRLMRFARLPSVPRSLAWSSNATKLFVGCNDGRVRIIDADSMQVAIELDGLVGRIHDLAVSPTSGLILTAGTTGCRAIAVSTEHRAQSSHRYLSSSFDRDSQRSVTESLVGPIQCF